MDDSLLVTEGDHPQVIIHIDIDCFYAQVEMVQNPLLKDKPVGIQQKNFMVTCNYIARSLGVKKSMRIDALKTLPDLVLIDGSDLTPYRHYSAEIFSILQKYTKSVEKLGLDENFIDVTEILDNYDENSVTIEGCMFSCNEDIDVNFSDCYCGCYKRLIKGTYIAKKIRDHIYNDLGITTCAGIAHSKLLAKLVSGFKKPNNQTVVFPSQVESVMRSLTSPKDIPGIGLATYKILEFLGVKSLKDLQSCSVDTLSKKFDLDFSIRLKNLAFGIDNSIVKPSGPPQTLSIEDSFKKISNLSDVKSKLEILIQRLLILLQEDGRFPNCLRLTVRKSFKDKLYGPRETKHAELHSSIFGNSDKTVVTSHTKAELMKVSLSLFNKMVNPIEPYHLTLLGVGFTKFFERAINSKSISQFFTKRLSTENILPYSKKAKTPTCEKNTLEDSTNLENESSINSMLEAQSCVESLDENDFNELPEDVKHKLKKSSESKHAQCKHANKINLPKYKKISKTNSRILKQNLLVKQKKIDSFFITSYKTGNFGKHSRPENMASTSLEDNKSQVIERNQISRVVDEQERIKQLLINKEIELCIFNELPQDIKEEILADLETK